MLFLYYSAYLYISLCFFNFLILRLRIDDVSIVSTSVRTLVAIFLVVAFLIVDLVIPLEERLEVEEETALKESRVEGGTALEESRVENLEL